MQPVQTRLWIKAVRCAEPGVESAETGCATPPQGATQPRRLLACGGGRYSQRPRRSYRRARNALAECPKARSSPKTPSRGLSMAVKRTGGRRNAKAGRRRRIDKARGTALRAGADPEGSHRRILCRLDAAEFDEASRCGAVPLAGMPISTGAGESDVASGGGTPLNPAIGWAVPDPDEVRPARDVAQRPARGAQGVRETRESASGHRALAMPRANSVKSRRLPQGPKRLPEPFGFTECSDRRPRREPDTGTRSGSEHAAAKLTGGLARFSGRCGASPHRIA